MKKSLLLLLTFSLCHEALFSEVDSSLLPVANPRNLSKDAPYRLERQKKVVQAEIDQLHQAFDGKSTLSYDIRYLDTGERVVEKNNYLRMHPGALIGIGTALSALELLGRNFTFKSTVTTKDPLSPSVLKKGGKFADNLYVDIFLDPHMDYSKMLELADQIKKKGISSIEGVVFADYPAIPLAEGWDLADNHPLILYMKGEIQIDKTVMSKPQAFFKALKEKGIAVKEISPPFLQEKDAMPKNLLASVSSEPLIPLLQKGWQERDAVTFEALVRALGETRQKSNKSLRMGLVQMRDFLSLRALLNTDEIALFDGSGTSTLSLLSVKQMTSLFLFAKNQFHLDADLLASMPLVKLKLSTKGPPCFARAILSTEGIVTSIAGILETEQKKKVVFCCIVNNATKEKEKAESFLNAFCQTLYENL